MRKRLGLLIAVGLMTAGCGTPPADTGQDDRIDEQEQQAEQEAAERAAQQARRLEVQREEFAACADATRPLTTALAEVDSRLSVGVSNDEYGRRLGDVRVVYDRLVNGPALNRVTRPCITKVAVPLENAFNGYIKVLGEWSDCIQDYACDFSVGQIDVDTQATWLRSSGQIADAKRALGSMRP